MFAKRKVFGLVVCTPECETRLDTYGFLRKNQIKNDEIVRYKAQLVAQGFSQNLILIYEKTYSLILDAITLKYLIIIVAQQCFHLHLMNDVTTYLYSSLENHIYMKILQGFYLPTKANSKEIYSIKLNKSFYWLKHSERVWYNRLIEYLLK